MPSEESDPQSAVKKEQWRSSLPTSPSPRRQLSASTASTQSRAQSPRSPRHMHRLLSDPSTRHVTHHIDEEAAAAAPPTSGDTSCPPGANKSATGLGISLTLEAGNGERRDVPIRHITHTTTSSDNSLVILPVPDPHRSSPAAATAAGASVRTLHTQGPHFQSQEFELYDPGAAPRLLTRRRRRPLFLMIWPFGNREPGTTEEEWKRERWRRQVRCAVVSLVVGMCILGAGVAVIVVSVTRASRRRAVRG